MDDVQSSAGFSDSARTAFRKATAALRSRRKPQITTQTIRHESVAAVEDRLSFWLPHTAPWAFIGAVVVGCVFYGFAVAVFNSAVSELSWGGLFIFTFVLFLVAIPFLGRHVARSIEGLFRPEHWELDGLKQVVFVNGRRVVDFSDVLRVELTSTYDNEAGCWEHRLTLIAARPIEITLSVANECPRDLLDLSLRVAKALRLPLTRTGPKAE